MSSNNVCPYLHLQADPESVRAYPAWDNCCNKVRRPAPVDLNFQQETCLTIHHESCPVFLSQKSQSLPAEMSANNHHLLERPLLWGGLLAAIVLVIIVMAAVLIKPRRAPVGEPLAALTSPTAAGAQQVITITTAAQVLPSAIPTATVRPTPRASVTPAFSTQLEKPIGLNGMLIIHQVRTGETLATLAEQYQTKTEIIQAINYFLPDPLSVGWLLVLPRSTDSTKGFPAFEIYLLRQNTPVTALAAEQGVDEKQLRHFNALGNLETIPAGSWMLLPRVKPTP